MRVGIYGGSFDPIHIAHLLLAETAAEQLQLDQVRFLPAAQSPLKDYAPAAPTARREMVQLAISGNSRFVLDDRELSRQGKSYTIDTLEQLSREFPNARLFLLIGSDSLKDFSKWYRPRDICQLAEVAVAHRGGEPTPDFEVLQGIATPEQITSIQGNTIEMPLLDIRSSELRGRIAKGMSIRYRVPAAVAAYLQHHQLYR